MKPLKKVFYVSAFLCSLAISSCSEIEIQESSFESMGQATTRALVNNEADIKINIASAELIYGTVYRSNPLNMSIDNDYSTNYGAGKIETPNDSVIIKYKLSDVQNLDYVRLYQRKPLRESSAFSKGSVWIQQNGNEHWELKKQFEVAYGQDVEAEINATNVQNIKITLYRSAANNNVALGEFECYQRASREGAIQYAQKYFTDATYSELTSGVTLEALSNIRDTTLRKAAVEMFNKTYAKEFRVRTYQSNLDPSLEARVLTIGKRSIYENATGIFLEAGKEHIIFVSGAANSFPMAICDFRNPQVVSTITLKEGINFITPTNSGNAYIQYWRKDSTPLNPVKIHFCNAIELGFWDVRQGHTDEDWKRILKLAVDNSAKHQITNAMISIAGERVQLINTVGAFEKYTAEKISETVSMHDELLYHEYVMMGLVKNNAVPQNRLLGKRSWGGNPNWAGVAANYPNSEQRMLDRSNFIPGIWVFAHEFGHANQIGQMTNGGWTEVTNNLYATYAQYQMCDRNNLRLEHESIQGKGSVRRIVGGRFNSYLREAFINKKLYFQHGGGVNSDGVSFSDPFVSLVPLWQMTLYFMITNERPNFWADVHWATIKGTNASSWGGRYINFMKRCIDASGMNLCDYFINMGLLKESERLVGDYGGPKQVNLTATMVQEVLNYAQGKPKPSSPVMGYISANSVHMYKNKLRLSGTFNTGLTLNNGGLTVSHSVWQNAVAYETYKDNQMIDICISGTGDRFNSTTFVEFPEGATRIEAVGYDGTRILVYGKR